MDSLMDTQFSYYPSTNSEDSKSASYVPFQSRPQSKMTKADEVLGGLKLAESEGAKVSAFDEMLKKLKTPEADLLHNYIINQQYSERRTLDNLLSTIPDLSPHIMQNFLLKKIRQELRNKRNSLKSSTLKTNREKKDAMGNKAGKKIGETSNFNKISRPRAHLKPIKKLRQRSPKASLGTRKRKRKIVKRGVKQTVVSLKPKKTSENFRIVLPNDQPDDTEMDVNTAITAVRHGGSGGEKMKIFKIKTENGQQFVISSANSDFQEQPRKNLIGLLSADKCCCEDESVSHP
ncbi:Hypothetical protein NTJ_07420 [Nesidiocoris tenuis]|uniref:BESS domain-containing protein n=1 Tax=Nesidiocoris tenuis TaxID=355587 RepID=A0ABN7AVY6_9HEMI|nr:Hypothetical protein NTJ_07420 [Nesidiocoris tenuis]